MKDYFEYKDKRYYFDKISSTDNDIKVSVKPFISEYSKLITITYSYNIYLGGDTCSIREQKTIYKYEHDENKILGIKKKTIRLFGFIPIKVKILNKYFKRAEDFYFFKHKYFRLKMRLKNFNITFAEYVARKTNTMQEYENVLKEKDEILRYFKSQKNQ